jgi:hypothetical protein
LTATDEVDEDDEVVEDDEDGDDDDDEDGDDDDDCPTGRARMCCRSKPACEQ